MKPKIFITALLLASAFSHNGFAVLLDGYDVQCPTDLSPDQVRGILVSVEILMG